MSSPLSARSWSPLFLSLGLAWAVSIQAAEGRVQSESASAAGATASTEAPEPDIRPNLKALIKKPERRAEPPEPAREASKAEKGKGGEAQPSVSMSELRDMIDQKVAEVRAKQAAAPVVKIQARSPRKKAVARPATPASGGASEVSSAGKGREAAGHDVHWAYSGDTGPESWGMLKPEYRQCMIGKRQSPIDIRDGIPVQLDPIQFDYHPTAFRVIDNGHTIQANVEPGNSITILGKRYELVQFHFHRPSEERINGKQYDMDVHLVHKDAEGHLAVIAILIEQGNAHGALQLVWNALPLEKGMEQASSVPIDLNQILPDRKQYMTYMGSLTTPPCTEGVLWMVMKQPAQMSREQIGIFSRMYQMNARPVQSAQGRMIKDGQ
ncbi:MAG TPA: carbonic anhydrase family protein [Aquabacterium sp.]|nr:carbonic anhydrase family protein [Aquabacterium sp.]